MNAQHALQQLQIGYQQSLKNPSIFSRISLDDLTENRPIAAIVSCSDARVVPEYIFDQPPGQLFVVRVAGNVVNADGLASLEFAVDRLNVPLIIVLGHSQCAAIQATVDAFSGGAVSTGYLAPLIAKLTPVIEMTKAHLHAHEDLCQQATIQNIKHNMQVIKAVNSHIATHIQNKTLMVTGAMYSVETGQLQFIESI